MIKENKHLPHLIVNVILAVALASSFIALFFFTYGKEVEKNIVIGNVEYIVDDLLSFPTSLLPDEAKYKLITYLDNVKLSDMTQSDQNVTNNNNELLKISGITLGSMLIISIIIAYIISKKYELDFPFTISQNLILLCGIALVEFIFLKYVLTNFISANPNIVKKKLLEALIK